MGNCNSSSAANLANDATGGCARRMRRGQNSAATRTQSVDSIEEDHRKLPCGHKNPSSMRAQSSKANAVTVSGGASEQVDVNRKSADENNQQQVGGGGGANGGEPLKREADQGKPLEAPSIQANDGGGNNKVRTNDEQQNQQTLQEDEDPAIRLQKLKEGLDFIETEEDVKAVESAALKIQSTFRGKKFRSKKPAAPEASGTSEVKKQPETEAAAKKEAQETELSERVAGIQVNDNSNNRTSGGKMASSSSAAAAAAATTNNNAAATSNLPEEEAERAATKIQAGFKGYKTRKELEGKLTGSGDSGAEGPATVAGGGAKSGAEVAPRDG